jgi:hypothetical protein
MRRMRRRTGERERERERERATLTGRSFAPGDEIRRTVKQFPRQKAGAGKEAVSSPEAKVIIAKWLAGIG